MRFPTGPALVLLAALGQGFPPLPAARAQGAEAALAAEVRRGLAATATAASDQPALRREGQVREPTPGFALGAALGAWINAADTLAYDLKTPSGDGGDAEAIRQDCYDERVAMERLETRRKAVALSPAQVLDAARVGGQAWLAAWRLRQAAAPVGCRTP